LKNGLLGVRNQNSEATMEHRFSPRSAIRLSAEIYHNQRYLGSFKTRNVGYRGLFVETGRIGLLCGSVVQVGLTIPGMPARPTLNAIVIHYSAEGAGLLFAGCQAESLSAVRGLLRTAA
jgi:hypothetical protein